MPDVIWGNCRLSTDPDVGSEVDTDVGVGMERGEDDRQAIAKRVAKGSSLHSDLPVDMDRDQANEVADIGTRSTACPDLILMVGTVLTCSPRPV